MAIREHPILFTGPMVQAILDDRKTQTRRVMKPQPLGPCKPTSVPGGWCDFGAALVASSSGVPTLRCPYGGPGDRLVPRTTWATERRHDHLKPTELPDDAAIWSYWDGPDPLHWGGELSRPTGKRRPGRFLPKRFWHRLPRLGNEGVRVQRVQEIGAEDCIAEGLEKAFGGYDMTDQAWVLAFQQLWDSINARRGYGWDTNPWVWAITFKREDG